MAKRNILEEALNDSKLLREAAVNNAKAVLMDSLKDSLKENIEKHLNETYEKEEEAHAEPDGDECSPDDTQSMDMKENLDMEIDEEEGDHEGEHEDEGDEHMDMDHEDGGLSESDLSEAIAEALDTINEVSNPPMGDMEVVDREHPRKQGFRDEDHVKEIQWDEQMPPDAEDHTVKETFNAKSLNKKVTELVKENILLKKANKKLRETVEEIKLFNSKIMYANKLIAKEGLSAETKKKIVSKMDMAKTVTEAKSIYEAFDCALGALSESASVKATKKAPALTEVLGSGASKPMNKEALKESLYGDSFGKARLQRLAGISSEED